MLSAPANSFFSVSEARKSFRYCLHKLDAQFRTYGAAESDGLSLIDFVTKQDQVIRACLAAVESQDYELQDARASQVFLDKPRKIHRFDLIDNFVLVHLALSIRQRAFSQLSDQVHSFRTGRSQKTALLALRSFLNSVDSSSPIYVSKRDVKQYGESMRHEIMQDIFDRLVDGDSRLLRLFEKVCKFKYKEGSVQRVNARGLPTGSYLQIIFENLYLHSVDQGFTNQPGLLYLRFGDDLLLASADKSIIEESVSQLRGEVADLGLEFNQGKSLDCKLEEQSRASCAEGEFSSTFFLEYLGMRIDRLSELSLPRRKLRALTSQLRARVLAAKSFAQAEGLSPNEELRLLIEQANAFLVRSNSFQSHRDELRMVSCRKQLKALDLWLAEMVLAVHLGRGWKKSNFSKISYKELKQLGLKSILRYLEAP